MVAGSGEPHIKVSNVEIKHVDLNEGTARAIAQQAEFLSLVGQGRMQDRPIERPALSGNQASGVCSAAHTWSLPACLAR